MVDNLEHKVRTEISAWSDRTETNQLCY